MFSKKLKIIFLIIILYLVASVALSLYMGNLNVSSRYAEQLYDYTRAKLCYECVSGNKDGICPKINRDPSLVGYVEGINPSYPVAREYEGEVNRAELLQKITYGDLNENEINEDLVIKYDYCYYKDGTQDGDYLTGFYTKPDKISYSQQLRNPNFYFGAILAPIQFGYMYIFDKGFHGS